MRGGPGRSRDSTVLPFFVNVESPRSPLAREVFIDPFVRTLKPIVLIRVDGSISSALVHPLLFVSLYSVVGREDDPIGLRVMGGSKSKTVVRAGVGGSSPGSTRLAGEEGPERDPNREHPPVTPGWDDPTPFALV